MKRVSGLLVLSIFVAFLATSSIALEAELDFTSVPVSGRLPLLPLLSMVLSLSICIYLHKFIRLRESGGMGKLAHFAPWRIFKSFLQEMGIVVGIRI